MSAETAGKATFTIVTIESEFATHGDVEVRRDTITTDYSDGGLLVTEQLWVRGVIQSEWVLLANRQVH